MGGPEGLAHARRIDRTREALPGLDGLRLVVGALEKRGLLAAA
jgi:hypothetical protein